MLMMVRVVFTSSGEKQMSTICTAPLPFILKEDEVRVCSAKNPIRIFCQRIFGQAAMGFNLTRLESYYIYCTFSATTLYILQDLKSYFVRDFNYIRLQNMTMHARSRVFSLFCSQA